MRRQGLTWLLTCSLILSLCPGTIRVEASSASVEAAAESAAAGSSAAEETETWTAESETESSTAEDETESSLAEDDIETSSAENAETSATKESVESSEADTSSATESSPASADESSAETEKDASWNEIISNTVKWMKGTNSQVLNTEFLSGVSSTSTDWYVFSLGRLGIQDNYSGFLKAADQDVREKYQKRPAAGLSTGAATEWHRLTMAVLAAGGDPLSVGGQNLIVDGVFNCKVGVPWKQGINGAIWALLAVDTMGYEPPADAAYDRDDLIEYILGNELKNGGWNLTGSSVDVDITAMAVQALAPYVSGDAEVKSAVDRAMTILHGTITTTGDVNGYGAPNCESTAQVIVAYASLGIDPDTIHASGSSKTLMDGLKRYYNTETGGFYHQLDGNSDSNNMATGQALYAIAAWRLTKKGTNLYDFRSSAEENETRITCADGTSYETGAGKNETIQVAPDAGSITITNLPMRNHAAAVITDGTNTWKTDYRRADGTFPVEGIIPLDEAGSGSSVDMAKVLTITVTHQNGTSETRTLTITYDEEALVNSIEKKIEDLPAAEELTMEDADAVRSVKSLYDRLDSTQKEQIQQADKLEACVNRIEELEQAEEVRLARQRTLLKAKIQAVKKPVTIAQENQILQYMNELEELGEWEQKDSLKATLDGYLKDIANRKALVEQLDQDIWNKIDPLRVNQKSESTVKALMSRYAALRNDEKEMLKNLDSLLRAEDIVRSLNDAVIPSTVFENMMATQEDFTYTGKTSAGDGYTIKYTGKQITSATEVNVKLSTADPDGKVKNSVRIIRIGKSGTSLNSTPAITLKVNVSDGTYNLKWLNPDTKLMQNLGTVSVKNGKLTMKVSMGGRYDLTKSTTKKSSGSGTKKSSQNGSSRNRGKTKTIKTSNLTQAAQNGILSSDGLKKIQGKDQILQTTVDLDENRTYTVSINGDDVTGTADFDVRVSTDCLNRGDMEMLAVNPVILCYEEQTTFPGTILVTINEKPWEENLMLFRYNAETRSAEFIKMVTAGEEDVRFTLEESGDYFIAARVMQGSLNDADEEEIVDIQMEEETVTAETITALEAETEAMAEDQTEDAEQEEEKSAQNAEAWIWILILLGAAGVAGVLFYRRKKKDTNTQGGAPKE